MLLCARFMTKEQADKAREMYVREFNKSLGHLLKGLREENRLKRRTVVVALPWLTGAKLRKYERGESSLPANLLAKMAEHYGDRFIEILPLLITASQKFRFALENDHP